MIHIQGAAEGRQPHSRNKKWVAGQGNPHSGHGSDNERWDRGGHRRRGGRGRNHHHHHGSHLAMPTDAHEDGASATEDEQVSGESVHEEEHEDGEPELNTPEEREKFYQELVKQREIERKRAISEGKMDDPLVPKRLDEAITMVGTCMDMCPRFERYRRERENNLDKWEVIPGTKRVDHKRAVKIYERAAGDKTLPSDLRPPPVLKKTLDYLFHDLLVREGFSQTYDFIRDRSRAVRNDFTMQHETGPLAMECHDRCARFHILALHLERDSPRFSVALEEQQLMNTLQSLKEFYEDQRGRYQSPTELEMRVYHRLIHIRDQKERHEDIPDEIRNHAVFRLTTQFRQRVQAKSAPITKTSKLVVDAEAMQIFSQLADVLREENNVVMIYLVACILERHFGKEAIDNIEAIRGDLSIPDIIDGISKPLPDTQFSPNDAMFTTDSPTSITEDATEVPDKSAPATQPMTRSATEWLTNNFGEPPAASQLPPNEKAFGFAPNATQSVFSGGAFAGVGPPSTSNPFGSGTTLSSSISAPAQSAFGNLSTRTSAFGGATFGPSTSAPPTSAFGSSAAPKSVFASSGSSSFAASASSSSPFGAPATATGIAKAVKPETPLSAQPTWPAESFASTSTAPPSQPAFFSAPPTAPTTSAPSGPTPPQGAPLNPFAASFVPPQFQPSLPAGPAQPSVQQPVDTKPPTQRPIFSDPFAAPSASPPKPPAPPAAAGSFFSTPSHAPIAADPVPLASESSRPPEPASTGADEDADRQAMPPPPTPPRIVERRQTLWDFPSSSSPFTRLREDSMTYTPPSGTPTAPSSPISPSAGPPALNKPDPLTLPPTPTTRWFESTDASLSRKRSLLHFPSLTMPTPTRADILSPIHVGTPSPSKAPSSSNGLQLFPGTPIAERPPPFETETTPTSGASESEPAAKAPKPVLEIQTNGFSPSSSKKSKAKETPADLEVKATNFLLSSRLVRGCWARWRKLHDNHKVWEEACKRSESYQAEVQRTRLSKSLNGQSTPEQAAKKRRVSSVQPADTVLARRVKRRKSTQFAEPLSDEALAQRLQQNREENERRWEQGSFRRTILTRLQASLAPGTELPDWCIWLSTNSVNDKTAIWLEHKFDVPASGSWVSENVFSIPAYNPLEHQGSPGLIVFERSPIEDVDDEIERKYRVIDDCARLRDILETRLPPEEERYTPSLVVINWSENPDDASTRDFVDMTHKAVRDGSLKHVSYFSVSATAKELDKKFADVINATPLDTNDRLSVKLSWKDIRKLLVTPVEVAISDMVDSCWSDDRFDWDRYDHVVVAVENILNAALRSILGLFVGEPSPVTLEIPEDLPQPGDLGRGYATGPFAEGLGRLLATAAQDVLSGRVSSPVTLPKDAVDAAVHNLENVIESQADRLRRLAADAARRISFGPSPKRRASQEDLRLNGSISSKRMRKSPSEDGYVETEVDGASVSPPPSTSGATDSGEKPLVTVAMLRALTRDVLKTYGSSSK